MISYRNEAKESKMNFYKSELAVKALEEYELNLSELYAKVKPLKDEFGGRAVFSHSATCVSFSGLSFFRAPSELWTKPQSRNGNTCRPRASVTGKENKAALRLLTDRYKSISGFDRVTKDCIYDAIGTNWGDVMFGGISMFKHDGFLYIKTGVKLNDSCAEILGSEYIEAKNNK